MGHHRTNPLRLVVRLAALALVASHCGPGNGTGFTAQGSVRVALREGSAAPTNSGFTFASQVRVDPTLPAGRADGFVGTCSVGPNERSVVLQRIGGDRVGLESVTFTLPDWSQDSCASCTRGTVSFVAGGAQFVGNEVAGSASPCQFRTSRSGSFDMRLQVQCRALQSGAKSSDLDVDLSLDLCNGPMSRN
jgi:hypothetical protein